MFQKILLIISPLCIAFNSFNKMVEVWLQILPPWSSWLTTQTTPTKFKHKINYFLFYAVKHKTVKHKTEHEKLFCGTDIICTITLMSFNKSANNLLKLQVHFQFTNCDLLTHDKESFSTCSYSALIFPPHNSPHNVEKKCWRRPIGLCHWGMDGFIDWHSNKPMETTAQTSVSNLWPNEGPDVGTKAEPTDRTDGGRQERNAKLSLILVTPIDYSWSLANTLRST